MEPIYERIGKKVDFKKLSQDICTTYQIGEYRKHKIIQVGIDDLSYYLWTTKGKYVVKNLNTNKSLKQINQFITQYDIIMKNNIVAPKMILNHGRHLFVSEIDGVLLNSCVMECIEGKDLFSLGKKITKQQIDKLIEIIIPLHQIKDTLEIEYDEWCFMNVIVDYETCKDKIQEELKQEIERQIERFKKIDFSTFPTCYIHGDLICTNIMEDEHKNLSLIDFTSSGTGLRILDIVKVMTSVIFHYEAIQESKELITYFLEQYQKYSKLTKQELELLPFLCKIDSYVGIMLTEYEHKMGKECNDKEAKFWMKNDLAIIQNF